MRILFYILFIVLTFTSTLSAQSNKSAYKKWKKEISQKHKSLNTYYRSDRSPLKPEHKSKFKAHDFYTPDTSFKVVARLEKFDTKSIIQMPTTTSRLPEYRRFAVAHFTINGTACALELYEPAELKAGIPPYLFLPFKDETSGDETYGGGRYLDLPVPSGESIEIDFNKAYYPYCAYNEKYSCPLVPLVNQLSVPIKAGIRGIPAH